MPAKQKLKARGRTAIPEDIALNMVQHKVGGLVTVDARVPMDLAQTIARLVTRRMQQDELAQPPKARRPR